MENNLKIAECIGSFISIITEIQTVNTIKKGKIHFLHVYKINESQDYLHNNIISNKLTGKHISWENR